MEEEYISISDMAKQFDLTRRTLLYYDEIGIFKPAHISENGYRFYSVYQIPILREISFLRKIGFSLDEIQDYLMNRTPEMAFSKFKNKKEELDREIEILQKKKEYITQRMEIFEHIDAKYKDAGLPYVKWYPERKAVFMPFETTDMNKKVLHHTLMKAWQQLMDYDMIPSKGFGAILREKYIHSDMPLRDAGSIIHVPFPEGIPKERMITLPEGEYVTMYKYGMPYELKDARELLKWTAERGYQIKGDIIDLCLLDTTFYSEEHKVDFCMLQIPINA